MKSIRIYWPSDLMRSLPSTLSNSLWRARISHQWLASIVYHHRSRKHPRRRESRKPDGSHLWRTTHSVERRTEPDCRWLAPDQSAHGIMLPDEKPQAVGQEKGTADFHLDA